MRSAAHNLTTDARRIYRDPGGTIWAASGKLGAKPMKIELKSGFQRGGSVRAVSGTFPDFTITTLASASENTWHDDGDSSCQIEVDDLDPRPIFRTRFWGVSSLSYESAAEPLNAAARALCAQPLPKGWAITIPGTNLGGATARDTFQAEGSIGAFVCDLVAGRGPTAHSPAQRRENYIRHKAEAVAAWEAAGLDGEAIWEARIPWSREEGVIALANKLADRYMGPSHGHRNFEELNGFRSALSHPRTQSAEAMAALTCQMSPDVRGGAVAV